MEFRTWTGSEPDPSPDGRRDPDSSPQWCAYAPCGQLVTTGGVSIAGLGLYCSRTCADAGEHEFDTTQKAS